MRTLVFALIVIAAAPAFATTAYSETTRNGFLQGCYPKEKNNMTAPQQANLKKMCDCALNNIQGAMTEDQFLKNAVQADKGMTKIKPLLTSCVSK